MATSLQVPQKNAGGVLQMLQGEPHSNLTPQHLKCKGCMVYELGLDSMGGASLPANPGLIEAYPIRALNLAFPKQWRWGEKELGW